MFALVLSEFFRVNLHLNNFLSVQTLLFGMPHPESSLFDFAKALSHSAAAILDDKVDAWRQHERCLAIRVRTAQALNWSLVDWLEFASSHFHGAEGSMQNEVFKQEFDAQMHASCRRLQHVCKHLHGVAGGDIAQLLLHSKSHQSQQMQQDFANLDAADAYEAALLALHKP